MASNNSKVLLGFEDELVTEKHKEQLNFTVNKIGGQPDWPCTFKPDPPLLCPLCQLPRPLILQIYAPLENSAFHRTLYLFACINPNCWTLSESWLCVRVQTVEKIEETNASATKAPQTAWCAMESDWGDDETNANLTEENGNIINETEKISDEDESCSFEDSLWSNFGNLTVVDEKNANNGAYGVAAGRQDSPLASAEIEGNEGEVISIDTPTMPQVDLPTLLQEVPPLPQDICNDYKRKNTIQFIPYFISVHEENFTNSLGTISDRHVKELLADYQKNDSISDLGCESVEGAGGGMEKYEKSQPAHGDKMFHNFLSKIQANPGQLLRYSREDQPLLLQPMTSDTPKKCCYCQGEVVFEFQVISTLIPKLKLVSDAKHCSRLEFGSVLIYTCKKSCWSTDTDFRLETVLLQNESY